MDESGGSPNELTERAGVDIVREIGVPRISLSELVDRAIENARPTWLAELRGGIRVLLEAMEKKLPANLRGVRNVESVEDIALQEGIPLAHAPRAAIVQQLIDAADYEGRRAVIDKHSQEMVDDCTEVLDRSLEEKRPEAIRVVAVKAAEAFRDGHIEAAQVLAVLASEQFLREHLDTQDNWGKSGMYRRVKEKVNKHRNEELSFVAYYNAFLPLLIAPTLFTMWNPGNSPSETLSRHATVHQVTAEHLNRVNAVIAIVQLTSLIGSMQWFQEWQKNS